MNGRLTLPPCCGPLSRTARFWLSPSALPPASWKPGRFRDLVSGKYGILAPKLHCPLVEPQDFDLAIVPCCTGNAKGQRLGYGGGYYDRYLPLVQCPTMLLCRSRLVTEDIPTEPHDQVMTYLVTEKGVTLCGNTH